MKVKKNLKKIEENDLVNDIIVDAIRDIMGKNIVKIDLRKIDDAPAQYFIICEGDSTVQVGAIAGNVAKRAKNELMFKNVHVEGLKESRWVLIDLFDTLVHVFYPETRAFYDIEDLWSDGHFVEYQDL